MTQQPKATAADKPNDVLAVDANTTLDIFLGPNNSVTELADTVDVMDGVRAETIGITNEQDGTHVEVISLEEPSPDQSDVDVVDNFVMVEGIGPEIAGVLLAGGIRTFKELANTPVTRIREIPEAAGSRFRIHDATNWPERAGQLAAQQSPLEADEAQLPYGFAQWPNEKVNGGPTA